MDKKRAISAQMASKRSAKRSANYDRMPIWAGDILHVLADMRRDMETGFADLRERLEPDLSLEHDAIDLHSPPDWPACEHQTFYDIATRGDEPIWFCEDCQTIVDEDEIE